MKSFKIFLILLFGVASLSITSCGWKPSEEEVKQLEETRAAALSAEQTLADKKVEKQDFEAKVAVKKAELEKIKADKEAVQQKVEQSNAQ